LYPVSDRERNRAISDLVFEVTSVARQVKKKESECIELRTQLDHCRVELESLRNETHPSYDTSPRAEHGFVQIKPKKTKQLKRKAGYSIVNPTVKRYVLAVSRIALALATFRPFLTLGCNCCCYRRPARGAKIGEE
jgi:hypothetical protein